MKCEKCENDADFQLKVLREKEKLHVLCVEHFLEVVFGSCLDAIAEYSNEIRQGESITKLFGNAKLI
jgi:hypothetical protein